MLPYNIKTYLLELREGDAFYRTEDNNASLCYRAVQMIWPDAQKRIKMEVSDEPLHDAMQIEITRSGGCSIVSHIASDMRQMLLDRVATLIEGEFGYVDILYVRLTNENPNCESG